jgi:hypothetical protein
LWDDGEALLMEALHAFNSAIETTPVDPRAEAVAALPPAPITISQAA